MVTNHRSSILMSGQPLPQQPMHLSDAAAAGAATAAAARPSRQMVDLLKGNVKTA
jgi:hypothetical protein